jgi:hypothetical protein
MSDDAVEAHRHSVKLAHGFVCGFAVLTFGISGILLRLLQSKYAVRVHYCLQLFGLGLLYAGLGTGIWLVDRNVVSYASLMTWCLEYISRQFSPGNISDFPHSTGHAPMPATRISGTHSCHSVPSTYSPAIVNIDTGGFTSNQEVMVPGTNGLVEYSSSC